MTTSAKKEILRQNARASFPYLIEITDETDKTVYRYANSDDDIIFNNQTYSASCFSVQPPEKSESKIGDGKLSLSIVDTQWIRRIREQKKNFSIKFIATIVYYANDNQRYIEEIDSVDFTLTNANWSDETIDWTMKFDDYMDIVMPCDKLTELICSGVV